MTTWKEYKLGDLVTFQRGHDLPRTDMKEGIYPVAGSNSIIGFHNVFTTKSPGITIGRSGNIGNPQLHKTNFWAHNTVLYVTEFKKVDPVFFYYLLKTLDFSQLNSGSAVPSLNRNFIHPFIVSVPDNLPTQTAIAEILSSLDDKIELNNKINAELEKLAQTLFKQWFIDFEFPNDLGDPYKSSGGEMIDSELGMLPKGWEVKSLEEIAKITIGRTPPRNEHQWFSENPNDIKWISIKDMGNCGTYIINTSEFLTEEAVSKFNVPIIEKNTVIISFKLTVGRISITTERMLSNEAIAHLNLFDNLISPEFIYLYLKQFDFDSLGSTSSIATAVNSKAIKALSFIYPNKKVLEDLQVQVGSIFEQILNNSIETQELTNLRDTLLPKLITGELEVSEVMAEKV